MNPTDRRFALVAVLSFALGGIVSAESGSVLISTDRPGVGQEEPGVLLLAIPIVNRGAGTATEIEVESIILMAAKRLAPTALPVSVGSLSSKHRAVVDAAFSAEGLKERGRYVLVVKGRYVAASKAQHFSGRHVIEVPPRSPGSGQLRTARVESHTVRGAPYRPQQPKLGREVNEAGPPVPTGTLRGDLKPATKATQIGTPSYSEKAVYRHSPTGSPGRFVLAPAHSEDASDEGFERTAGNDLVFVRNTALGNIGTSPQDSSVASGGGFGGEPEVVFTSGNWYGAYSVDGGASFKTLNPTAIFPNNDAAGNQIDGGFCCDQVIHYSARVQRFFWLMQFSSGPTGENRLRLASASPSAIVSSGGTAWTYWDLTSATFGLGNASMDYPDMSVGDNYLYVSVDNTGAGAGLLVARIPLTDLQAGGGIGIGYTTPSDSASAYGVHMIQSPGDEIFWAGHPSASVLRVFSCKEGSNQYFWRDVKIASYPQTDFTSISPDGSDWLGSLFSGGPGGVRLMQTGMDEIWFEWMGARGGGFPFPHVQVVRLNHSDLHVIEQTQIWNDAFAFGHASFTSANLRVGMALAYGGGPQYGTAAVGIFGDLVVYSPCSSAANSGRYGDYTTVRQASPNGALFSAEVYCVGAGPVNDPHYVLFGRSDDVNPPPIGAISPNAPDGWLARADGLKE